MLRFQLILLCGVLLFFASIPLVSGAIGESDFKFLTEGVDGIGTGSDRTPGPLCVFGKDAIPILIGKDGNTLAPLLAAAKFGKGRVIAFGHSGYLSDGDVFLTSDGTRRLASNIFRWLSGENKAPRIAVVGNPKFADFLETFRYEVQKLDSLTDPNATGKFHILVIEGSHIPPDKIGRLTKFISDGGALYTASLGWGWLQNPNHTDLKTEHPGNLLLAPMGIVWTDGYLAPTLEKEGKKLYPVSPDGLPKFLNVTEAIAAINAHEKGTQKLQVDQLAQAVATVKHGIRSIPASQSSIVASLNKRYIQHVNAIVDIAHDFTFFDENPLRYRYLKDHDSFALWQNLYSYSYDNVNLLILPGCDDKINYNAQDLAHLQKLLKNGVGVVVFGEANRRATNELLGHYGTRFCEGAAMPLKALQFSDKPVATRGRASYLEFDNPGLWSVVVEDNMKRPVIAYRKSGNGIFAVCPRSLMADASTNASDSFNADVITPLFVHASLGYLRSPADQMTRPLHWGDPSLDNQYTSPSGILLTYTDYLVPYANAMVEIIDRTFPYVEDVMGVPLAGTNASKIVLLPTGGGGFSGGTTLGLAVWWGGFPERDGHMVELIGHEAVHAWVLPRPEMWNEPIATYVGNLVQLKMGDHYTHYAEETIAREIAAYYAIDPSGKVYDIFGNSKDPVRYPSIPDHDSKFRSIHWGKSFIMFEELRKREPDWVAKYFTKKRAVYPEGTTGMTLEETIQLLDSVLDFDVYSLFQEYGFPGQQVGGSQENFLQK